MDRMTIYDQKNHALNAIQKSLDKIDKLRGMEISIVTTARSDQEGRRLLALLGMPFKK